MKRLIITGAAGFIGSALVRKALARGWAVQGIDKLTYAGNLHSLDEVRGEGGFDLEIADIRDREAVCGIFERFRPTAILHLAAESHVDRSVESPGDFLRTNIDGTYVLLETARAWVAESGKPFRFHHVSTDEVFGDLGEGGGQFTEGTAYNPSSPYSASKAAADHLVRAWHRTYGLPVVITNSSNNYGPRQFPEKLIPHMILHALSGKPLPVYGDGSNIRDWLHVDDHAEALLLVLERGVIGETYNIGGNSERRNIDLVRELCALLEELAPDEKPEGVSAYEDLITFVRDRPGHDLRYAIDTGKIERELGWHPTETFATGLRKTVQWYLDNRGWWERILDGSYRLERVG